MIARHSRPAFAPSRRAGALFFRRILALGLLLALVGPAHGRALEPAGGPPTAAGTADAASAEAPATARPERPDAIVRAIYRALDGKDDSLSPARWTEPETARRLFEPGLAALAEEEGRRSVPDRRLPFDPFTGALQIRPSQIGVKVVSAAPRSAEIMVRFTVSRMPRTVSYRLSYGAQGWRIADIWWGTDKRRTFKRLLR